MNPLSVKITDKKSFKSFTLKLDGMRKEQSFVIYPFIKGTPFWTLQSDTRIIRVFVDGSMVMSKPIPTGAYFAHLSPLMGAIKMQAPQYLIDWLLDL